LRKASLIRQLLLSLQELAPDGVQISIFELHDIPLYNQDIEDEVGFPPAVQKMRAAISKADGVIFATPEYNGSITGILKNSIDWASRQGLLAKVPATPITGSPGALGATKAQEHLRSVMGHLGMCVMSRPAIAIPQMQAKIKDQTITDEATRKFVSDWLEAFRDWIVQLNK
jgi:chromate reductase